MTRNNSTAVGIAGLLVVAVLGFGALLVFIGIFAPALVQGILYSMLVKVPSIPLYGGIGAALIGLGAIYDTSAGKGTFGGGTLATFGVLFILFGVLIAPMIGSAYMKVDMAENIEGEEMEQLPEASQNHTRVAPRAVADKKADNSMRDPKKKLGDSDITYHNGSYYWSYPIQPDGIANIYTEKQDGMKLVPIGESDARPQTVRGEFESGHGMKIYDNVQWTYAKDNPTAERETDTAFTLEHDGELYNAQAFIEHDWKFRAAPIPVPYAVPEMGGVQMVDQDGNVETLSREEAQNDERLEGQNFYPYQLAQLKMTTQAYEHGWLNTMFGHEDHLVLADVPAPDNSQPFTQFTGDRDNPSYTVLAEPYGSSTNGIYEVWVIDGQSGEPRVYHPEVDGGLIGPARAAEKIRGERPNVNFGDSGDMQVSEMHPVFRNGTLYYKGSVVTDGNSYSYTAFVDAETGEVYEYSKDAEVIAFANGEISPGEYNESSGDSGNESASDGDGDNPPRDSEGMVVFVTDEDGNIVDRIVIEEGHSITVEAGEGNQTASAEA